MLNMKRILHSKHQPNKRTVRGPGQLHRSGCEESCYISNTLLKTDHFQCQFYFSNEINLYFKFKCNLVGRNFKRFFFELKICYFFIFLHTPADTNPHRQATRLKCIRAMSSLQAMSSSSEVSRSGFLLFRVKEQI